MKKRFLALFLTLSLMVPCLAVPTSAALALPGGVAAGATAVRAIPALSAAAAALTSGLSKLLGEAQANVQTVLDYLVSVTGVGNLGMDGLQSACNRLNQIAANPDKYAQTMYDDCIEMKYLNFDVPFESFYKTLVNITAYDSDIINWHIINHQEYGYVIVNQKETFILSNSIG